MPPKGIRKCWIYCLPSLFPLAICMLTLRFDPPVNFSALFPFLPLCLRLYFAKILRKDLSWHKCCISCMRDHKNGRLGPKLFVLSPPIMYWQLKSTFHTRSFLFDLHKFWKRSEVLQNQDHLGSLLHYRDSQQSSWNKSSNIL